MFALLENLRHFAFEATLSVVALALVGAGLALLFAPTAVERMPLVGAFLTSIRTAAATTLISTGVGCLAFVGGYMHRGAVERQTAALEKIETSKAIKAERDRRDAAIAAARKADAELADNLAVELQALRDSQGKDDEISRDHDGEPGLPLDSVQRLNAIGRPVRRR